EGPLRQELESQIARLGLSGRVHLLGFRRDVPDLLAHADLSVIASRREGFGYTLAEALLLRRLVVSTDVPAANEVLPRSFLVPREDPAALRATIVRVLADPAAALGAFQPVWHRASAEFTIEAMVAATARLYRHAIEANARRMSG
ncbi:MAG: glycosyltransferase, partial [Planctomycetaceae bacterium]